MNARWPVAIAGLFLLGTGVAHAQDAPCPLRIQWSRTTDLQQAVGGPAFGVLGGNLIIAGGTSWLDETNKIWSAEAHAFDLQNNTWSTIPPMPGKAGYPCALSFDGAFYVFGGQSAKEINGRDTWKLSRTSDTWKWEPFTRLPENLANMQAALAGSTAFLVAGDSGGDIPVPDNSVKSAPAPDNKVWKIDLGGAHPEWTACAPLPGAMRTGVATTACNGKLYSFGGCVTEAYAYDPKTDQWEKIQDLPYPSQWSWAVSYQDRYIVIPGGFVAKEQINTVPPSIHLDANGFIADVLVYDTNTGKYSLSDPLPKGIIDYGLARIGDRLYLAGGEDRHKHRESWLLTGTLSISK